jgi:hypothetical protein
VRAPGGANAPAEQVLDPVEAQRRGCDRILHELPADEVAEAREVLEAMQERYAERTPAPPSGTQSTGTFVAERVGQRVRPEFSADPDEF